MVEDRGMRRNVESLQRKNSTHHQQGHGGIASLSPTDPQNNKPDQHLDLAFWDTNRKIHFNFRILTHRIVP